MNQNIANLPVTAMTGVTHPLTDKLAELGIYRLFDLALHLPKDYEDKSQIIPIGLVQNGMHALISGTITHILTKNGLVAQISDNTGTLNLKFFKTYPALLDIMRVGQKISAFGEIKISQFGTQIVHPEYYITGTRPLQRGLLPIYPTVKGLHQNKLRNLIKTALNHLATQLICLSDDELIQSGVTPYPNGVYNALLAIHDPDPKADIFSQTLMLDALKARTHADFKRLVLEELVAHQLTFLFRRENIYQYKAPLCLNNSTLADKLIKTLPFNLTDAQQRVIDEAVRDMTTSYPMLRLIQGDVGAGKTLVAGICACYAIDSGWQVAVMAPTEILAEQHFINFQKWFEPLGVTVGFVAGKQTAKQRKDTLDKIQNAQIDIVIGTHALFYDGVVFAKLGLCVIDEQHRFGVEQRLRLASKGVANSTPHQLAMTATPIPRTLAMSLYGDMDISVIDELPPNRTPIVTVMAKRSRRDEVLMRVKANCLDGKQAYWVCPLVEDGDNDNMQSAEVMFDELSQNLDIRVGLVHGKMRGDDKQKIMNDFKNGNIDLLIATTVIEVGVDVPNASLMIIENAERLGLSQLHQLRGRVGRGATQSYCVLLYQDNISDVGLERLRIIRDSTDGFLISEADLKMRGAGELLGKRQAGDMGYYVADIVRDEVILTDAKKIAKHLLSTNKPKAFEITNLWLKDTKDYVYA